MIDNVFWAGRVLEPVEKQSEDTKAIDALNTKLATDDRVEISMLGIGDGVTFLKRLK